MNDKDRILEIINEYMPLTEFEESIEEAGIDDMDSVEIHMEVEELLGIEINDNFFRINDYESIGKWIDWMLEFK